MKNKYVIELVYILVVILAISSINYLTERTIGISVMPLVALIIGIVITIKLFKEYDNQMSVVLKIIPVISILVYLLFTIFLYLGLFNLINWENQPWLHKFSMVVINLYIIAFLPISFYLLLKKYIKNSI